MTKQAFRQLFENALRAALDLAGATGAENVVSSIKIELHAPNSPYSMMSFDAALDEIYLGPDRFYKIIDVATWKTSSDLLAFVRVSGHTPCPLDQTWDPSGLGPFKPMIIRSLPNRRYEAAK